MKKVFNCLNHEIFLVLCFNYGLPGAVLSDYLVDRWQYVRVTI